METSIKANTYEASSEQIFTATECDTCGKEFRKGCTVIELIISIETCGSNKTKDATQYRICPQCAKYFRTHAYTVFKPVVSNIKN